MADDLDEDRYLYGNDFVEELDSSSITAGKSTRIEQDNTQPVKKAKREAIPGLNLINEGNDNLPRSNISAEYVPVIRSSQQEVPIKRVSLDQNPVDDEDRMLYENERSNLPKTLLRTTTVDDEDVDAKLYSSLPDNGHQLLNKADLPKNFPKTDMEFLYETINWSVEDLKNRRVANKYVPFLMDVSMVQMFNAEDLGDIFIPFLLYELAKRVSALINFLKPGHGRLFHVKHRRREESSRTGSSLEMIMSRFLDPSEERILDDFGQLVLISPVNVPEKSIKVSDQPIIPADSCVAWIHQDRNISIDTLKRYNRCSRFDHNAVKHFDKSEDANLMRKEEVYAIAPYFSGLVDTDELFVRVIPILNIYGFKHQCKAVLRANENALFRSLISNSFAIPASGLGITSHRIKFSSEQLNIIQKAFDLINNVCPADSARFCVLKYTNASSGAAIKVFHEIVSQVIQSDLMRNQQFFVLMPNEDFKRKFNDFFNAQFRSLRIFLFNDMRENIRQRIKLYAEGELEICKTRTPQDRRQQDNFKARVKHLEQFLQYLAGKIKKPNLEVIAQYEYYASKARKSILKRSDLIVGTLNDFFTNIDFVQHYRMRPQGQDQQPNEKKFSHTMLTLTSINYPEIMALSSMYGFRKFFLMYNLDDKGNDKAIERLCLGKPFAYFFNKAININDLKTVIIPL